MIGLPGCAYAADFSDLAGVSPADLKDIAMSGDSGRSVENISAVIACFSRSRSFFLRLEFKKAVAAICFICTSKKRCVFMNFAWYSPAPGSSGRAGQSSTGAGSITD